MQKVWTHKLTKNHSSFTVNWPTLLSQLHSLQANIASSQKQRSYPTLSTYVHSGVPPRLSPLSGKKKKNTDTSFGLRLSSSKSLPINLGQIRQLHYVWPWPYTSPRRGEAPAGKPWPWPASWVSSKSPAFCGLVGTCWSCARVKC